MNPPGMGRVRERTPVDGPNTRITDWIKDCLKKIWAFIKKNQYRSMLFEQFLRYLYSNNRGQRGVGRGGGGAFWMETYKHEA